MLINGKHKVNDRKDLTYVMSGSTLLIDRQTDRRIPWLDSARAFAILAVLLVHATEHLYVMDAAHLNGMSPQSALFAITAFTIGRLGVPLFLFLTGFNERPLFFLLP